MRGRKNGMGFRSSKALEKGYFLSPALGIDSLYELIEDASMPNGLAVRCLESNNTYPTEVLAAPPLSELAEQHRAAVREISAWLVANGQESPNRKNMAVQEVRRLTGADYIFEDLASDVLWVRNGSLSPRLHLLGKHLDEARRKGLLVLATTVGAAGGNLSQSDVQFIELLGTGLKLDSRLVEQVVLASFEATMRHAA